VRKTIVALLLLSLAGYVHAQEPKKQKTPATLRSILLEQLQTTHNKQDWFVSANTAVAGLTPEQASWTDGKGNHSVGQLAYHILYWDKQSLAKFKGETPEKFSGNNDDTFTGYDPKKWAETVQQLDQVMTDLEKLVQAASEKQLAAWAPTIARIGTHNAYHIGEIVMVRKEQGVWDASKGIK
jgi:uncharacterized damage-inducible protein DinB